MGAKRTILARCPNCGKGLVVFAEKYYCARCKFRLWKDNIFLKRYGLTLTDEIVIAMCRRGSCRLTNLYAKRKKKYFAATLVWQDRQKGIFALEFGRPAESAPAGMTAAQSG
ncbi:MAG TPA: hypothetical protein PKM88_05190 [bacterium]|nr:hypothetical protein [bacterium]